MRQHAPSIGQKKEACDLFSGLLSLPTLYEEDSQAALVTNAIRQNIKATMISPLTALQWVHMSVMAHDGWANEAIFAWDDPVARAAVGKAMVKTFEGLMKSYDTKVTEEGVVVQTTVPKRPRKARRSAQSGGGGFAVTENQLLLIDVFGV